MSSKTKSKAFIGAMNMLVPQAGSNPQLNDIDQGVEEELQLLGEQGTDADIPQADLLEIMKNAIREWIRSRGKAVPARHSNQAGPGGA